MIKPGASMHIHAIGRSACPVRLHTLDRLGAAMVRSHGSQRGQQRICSAQPGLNHMSGVIATGDHPYPHSLFLNQAPFRRCRTDACMALMHCMRLCAAHSCACSCNCSCMHGARAVSAVAQTQHRMQHECVQRTLPHSHGQLVCASFAAAADACCMWQEAACRKRSRDLEHAEPSASARSSTNVPSQRACTCSPSSLALPAACSEVA